MGTREAAGLEEYPPRARLLAESCGCVGPWKKKEEEEEEEADHRTPKPNQSQ